MNQFSDMWTIFLAEVIGIGCLFFGINQIFVIGHLTFCFLEMTRHLVFGFTMYHRFRAVSKRTIYNPDFVTVVVFTIQCPPLYLNPVSCPADQPWNADYRCSCRYSCHFETSQNILLDQERVEIVPTGLSFAEAASISISFETALGALKKANIKPRDSVIICGASGGVCTFAIQIAKAMGATVIGICSTRNLAQAQQLGCDQVIDYKTQDFRQVGKRFNAIISINGCNPMKDYQTLHKPHGIFVGVGNAKLAGLDLAKSFTSKQFTYLTGITSLQKGYLTYAKKLVDQGQLRPIIDKVYHTSEIQDVIRYCIKEHPQGKVVHW